MILWFVNKIKICKIRKKFYKSLVSILNIFKSKQFMRLMDKQKKNKYYVKLYVCFSIHRLKTCQFYVNWCVMVLYMTDNYLHEEYKSWR